jgi:peptide/nickel transport system substrate-binding protein
MQFGRKLRLAITISAAAASLSLGLITPTLSGAAAPKGTLTVAEGPGANPNYIFPYVNGNYISVNNLNDFQFLMFRPLYWFGLGNSSAVSFPISPAKAPVWSNASKTVTITMKGWKFADGQTVNAESVMFFLNMYKADPTGYAGYNGGFGIPDQVASASGSGNTVKITFNVKVNPNWILYNYLSEITPFPNSWDKTSATQSANCASGTFGAASTDVACKNVEAYLIAQSSKTSTFTDKMWQSGDDGPYKLTAFDSLGNATFQPNSHYSGPQKSQVKFVKEVAYTSAQAEENDLQAGKLSLGFVDPSILTSPAKNGKAGPNWGPIASRYTLETGPEWAFNYAPLNFGSNDPKQAALNQLYIRQALQESINEQGIITNVFKGYASPMYSPLPQNAPKSLSGPVPNPYPFSLANAKALLTSNGWTEESGLMTCTSPGTATGDCGTGITAGYTLNFKIFWASGSPSLDQEFNAEIADWAQIGIKFTSSEAAFNNVVADCNGAEFQICSWGGGWTYAPDYYPSGEEFFTPTSGWNPGGYSDPQMTTLIEATTYGNANLTAYLNYAAKQVPVLWEPETSPVAEHINTLNSKIGWVPNPCLNFNPEYLSFK